VDLRCRLLLGEVLHGRERWLVHILLGLRDVLHRRDLTAPGACRRAPSLGACSILSLVPPDGPDLPGAATVPVVGPDLGCGGGSRPRWPPSASGSWPSSPRPVPSR